MDIKELKNNTTLQSGKYTIEHVIGAGGFGITYYARHNGLGHHFAIKEFFIGAYCMRNSFRKTVMLQGMDNVVYEKYLQKFIEEAQTLARLDHPNIVKVTDIFQENNTAYIVMPFVEGQTLQQLVEQKGKLDYETAVNYMAQIAEAVDYIHTRDILHRDIKPENIIITPENKAILIDFGSAREFIHDKTQQHTSIYTQGYAPLEQYAANSRKGSYSDIYSLGATFYFALTGEKPMDAATRTMETMPEPKALVSDIPEEANRTIMKAMELKPEERQQRVGEFMGDLLNVEQKQRKSTIKFPSKNKKKQNKRNFLLFLLIIAVLGITSVLFYTPPPIYLAPVGLNEKYGFIDKTGREVIPLKYDAASSFSDELAMVMLNEKCGFIDKKGKEIIPLKYDDARDFSEELACVKLNGEWGFIDKKGKEVISFKYDEPNDFSEGLASMKLNGEFGFIDKNGKEVIAFKYEMAGNFSEGLASVQNEDWDCGFIDKNGDVVIPLKFGSTWDFSEGLAMVSPERTLGKYGFINKNGKEIISLKYAWVKPFSEGLAVVRIYRGGVGFIDKNGIEIILPKYDDASNFSEGLAMVKLNKKMGFIDREGKEVIPLKYDEVGLFFEKGFSEGLAPMKLNGKYGFIDRLGKEIIPFNYEYAGIFKCVR
jgi:serine/threonine protein kinase